MKKRISLLLMSILVTYSFAQNTNCSCKDDLIFLDQKIRKTPAYKMNKRLYEKSYSDILQKVDSEITTYNCFVLTNTLLLSLNDNHSRVYGKDNGATAEVKDDSNLYADFKKSLLFNAYPRTSMDLDSLTSVLKSKPKDDKEGIYSIKDYLTIGVYKSKNEDNYKAIVLNSETDIWSNGEIIYTLIPYGNDYLLSLGGSPSSKRMIAYTERIEQGIFYFMGFKKDEIQNNYSLKTLSEETFYRKEISDNVTYIKVGSFSSWYPTLSDAENFYDRLDGNLTKSNLIIDLRNNSGGGDRNSDILYKIIKDYANQNKVYVLINHRTTSNAEQFAHKLSNIKNCLLFGERTNGTIAFEVKNGSYTLPCNNFVATLSSKKHSKYLEYESEGIKPDVILRIDTDWLEQLEKYINKNN